MRVRMQGSRAQMNASTEIKPFYAIIFGGDGDLSRRKIIPAFFYRWLDGQLNMDFKVLCISRSIKEEKKLKSKLRSFIKEAVDQNGQMGQVEEFFKRVHLVNLAKMTDKEFEKLAIIVNEHQEWQRVYYLSVPSSAFAEICGVLKSKELIRSNSKVVLEQP